MTKVAFSFIKVPFYHTARFVGADETVGRPGIRDAWRAREKSVPYSYSGSSNKPRTHEITTGATFEVIAIHVAHTHSAPWKPTLCWKRAIHLDSQAHSLRNAPLWLAGCAGECAVDLDMACTSIQARTVGKLVVGLLPSWARSSTE